MHVQIAKQIADLEKSQPMLYLSLCKQILQLCENGQSELAQPPKYISQAKLGYKLCLRRAEIEALVGQGLIQVVNEEWMSKYKTRFFEGNQVSSLTKFLLHQASLMPKVIEFANRASEGQERALKGLFHWQRAVLYPHHATLGEHINFYLQREGTNTQPIPALEKHGFIAGIANAISLTELGVEGGRYLTFS
jgi:hypothetical protein